MHEDACHDVSAASKCNTHGLEANNRNVMSYVTTYSAGAGYEAGVTGNAISGVASPSNVLPGNGAVGQDTSAADAYDTSDVSQLPGR